MPSSIRPDLPLDHQPTSKQALRANWASARAEIEHGGFFRLAAAGGVERPVADRLAEVASVRDFGAVGDGVTDDTKAVQAALRASPQVVVPAGARCLVGNVEVEGRSIIGPGEIVKAASAEHAVRLSGEASTLEGLSFSAQPAARQPHACVRIGEGARDAVVSRCSFRGGIDYKPTCYSAIAGAPDTAIGGTPYAVPAQGLRILENRFDGFVRPLFLHSAERFVISENVLRRSSHDAIRIRERCEAGRISFNQFFEIGSPDVGNRETRDCIDT